MPGIEATEEFRDDTTHYYRQGLIVFYQIMLPLCDTPLSGIRENKRPLYQYEVEIWSNIYAYQIGIGGSYGHGFKYVKRPEFFSMMDEL